MSIFKIQTSLYGVLNSSQKSFEEIAFVHAIMRPKIEAKYYLSKATPKSYHTASPIILFGE